MVVTNQAPPRQNASNPGRGAFDNLAVDANDVSASDRSDPLVSRKAGGDGAYPVRSRRGIVIGDGDELPACGLTSTVEGSNLSRPVHEHSAHREVRLGHDPAAILVFNSEHDDDLGGRDGLRTHSEQA
jgi:hypothetical protein